MTNILENDLKFILEKTNKIFKQHFAIGSKLFLTGATGFFGKWLLESFLFINDSLNLDIEIFALSRNPEKFLLENPQFKNDKVIKWIKGDIKTFRFPESQFNYIIHAATDADARLNKDMPLLMLDTITTGTRRILDFAKRQPDLKALLLTSSGAIYGEQPQEIAQIKEEDSFYLNINSPISSYAEGKRLSELYCAIYSYKFNIPVKIARCFAFVGPYLPLNKHFAIGNFLSSILKGERIIIYGDGTPIRSYLYPTDLVIWLLTIILKGRTNYPYNVGSENEISIRGLAELICKLLESSNGYEIKTARTKNKHIDRYVPSVSRAQKELNLAQTVNLSDAILKTYNFHINQKYIQ